MERPLLSAGSMSCRLACVLLCSLWSVGCYASHERADHDASVGRDAPGADAATVLDRPDASVPSPRCESLAAAPAILLTHAPPNDFALGSVQATGPTGALVAFTSSNDAREMDVSRWVLPIDLRSGAPRRDDRITVFGEPEGLTYSAHSRVVVGARSTLAFTWSEGQGCLRRRLDADGGFLGPELRDAAGPCLSARLTPTGDIVFLRREAIERAGMYFEWVDDEGRQTMVTGIGAASLELAAVRSFTWSIDLDGSFAFLASDTTGMRFGRWDREGVLAWRPVEGSSRGSSMRLVAVGGRLLGAWLSAGGLLELAYFDDARLVATEIAGLPQAALDLAVHGEELWVATAVGGTHADARASIARLDLELREIAPRTEVGAESFVSALRLLPTETGALLVQQAQRGDAAGGTNLFATSISCDAGPRRPTGCAPWMAADDTCGPCAASGGYLWDGARCAEITCDCVGPDCRFAYDSREACQSDHADCSSSRCERTGGVWLQPNHRYCSAPVCGDDTSACTEMPEALCHCGMTALYDARRGCVPGFCTGRDSSDRRRCEASGGTWGTFCSHSHCGEAPDPCVDEACRCADDEIWSDVAGCIPSSECTPITCEP